MNRHYFNSIEEAEKYIATHNIGGLCKYHYETPTYLENGVDLVIHYTKEQAVNIIVEQYGWSKQGAEIYVNMFDDTNDIDWSKIKNYKKTHFICEICGELTPFECEGSEPNTCAMCMPLPSNDFMGQN